MIQAERPAGQHNTVEARWVGFRYHGVDRMKSAASSGRPIPAP